MLKAISQFSAGRRSKWVVIAAWVIVVTAVGGYSGKLQDALVAGQHPAELTGAD